MRRALTNALALLVCAHLTAAGPAAAGQFDGYEQLNLHLVGGGPPKDGIPAVTNPELIAPAEADWVLDTDLVMGVVIDGEARAYPQNLGWWHEIINDRFAQRSVSVTLCPLTGTGLVFDATDRDGSQIEFGVSGLLINSNLVMYDRRDNETLYPQMIFTGINGDFKGEQLELLPALETTWGLWKKLYPDTKVAQRVTGLERYNAATRARYANTIERYEENLGGYPYGDYRTNDQYLIFAPTTSTPDLSLYGTKEVVLGVCLDGETKAYPFRDLPDGSVINDLVGDQPMVILYDADTGTAIAYSSEVAGQIRGFYAVPSTDGMPIQMRDAATRSLWNMRGEAIDGPLKGAVMEQIPAYNSMWFAWHTYWPRTQVWDGEGVITEADLPPLEEGTAVEEARLDATPQGFSLGQNRPNPFNPNTLIGYQLPVSGTVRLAVYNGTGQRVRTLSEGHRTAGRYEINWDGLDAAGRAVSSGIYFYRLEMPGQGLLQTRSMSLVR